MPPSPQTVWENGAVVVALAAFAGVLATSYCAHRRMLRELSAAARNATIEREQTRDQAQLDRQHAADEAHKERIAGTRREVYLEAIAALGTAQEFLGGLANGELDSSSYQRGMMPLNTAVNRIAVVGEVETVKTARDLVTSLNESYFKAAVMVLPLAEQRWEIKHQHERWEASQVEIKRILAAMTNHNESSSTDQQAFDALMASFKSQQRVAQSASEAEQRAHQALILGKMQYADFIVAMSRDLALMLDVLADSVRRELNIETDFASFRAQTLEMLNRVQRAMADFKATIAAKQAESA